MHVVMLRGVAVFRDFDNVKISKRQMNLLTGHAHGDNERNVVIKISRERKSFGETVGEITHLRGHE